MITPEELKGLMRVANYSYPMTVKASGVPISWFMKMLQGKYHNPDPARMMKVRDMLHEVIRIHKKYRGDK